MAKYSLMFMNTITPLHNGAGEGYGIVDNPIIRERTTLFPFVQSTSVKGVLRDYYSAGADDDTKVQALFGPPSTQGESHGGAVSFSDSQLFAFPVRSLKGGFVWTTTPLILFRLMRLLEIAGLKTLPLFQKLENLFKGIDASFNKSDRILLCPEGETQLLIGQLSDQRLILEEFPKVTGKSPPLQEFAKEVSAKIFNAGSTFLKKEFEKKLVLLPENSFAYFVANATEIMPNIKIGKNGTTETGSLRYTEFLPAESILYSLISFNRPNEPGEDKTLLAKMKNLKINKNGQELTFDSGDERTKALFEASKPSMIQIGGDETTGKGLVKLSFI